MRTPTAAGVTAAKVACGVTAASVADAGSPFAAILGLPNYHATSLPCCFRMPMNVCQLFFLTSEVETEQPLSVSRYVSGFLLRCNISQSCACNLL